MCFSGGCSAFMHDEMISLLSGMRFPNLTALDLLGARYVNDTHPLSAFGATLTALRLRCGEYSGAGGRSAPPPLLPADLPLLKTLAMPYRSTIKSLGNYPSLESLEAPPETHALVWQKNIPLFANHPLLAQFDVSGFRHLTVENLESMMAHLPRLTTIETRRPSDRSRIRTPSTAVAQWLHLQKDKSAYVSFDGSA